MVTATCQQRNAWTPLPDSAPAWAREAEARLLTGKTRRTDRYLADPARILADVGLRPDVWQANLLREAPQRTLLCASRQSGKSQTCAGLALQVALTEPGSLVLLLSPSLRQSGELFRKVADLWYRLGKPVANAKPRENATRLELANGSRIESLPGTESTVRSFSAVKLLVIDEAARVSDPLYFAIRPMLAVSGGRLVALSSAWAKMGWFFEAFSGKGQWNRIKVTAHQCPRISREFLREEEAALGPRWYAMEYLAEFGDAVDALFTEADVRAALDTQAQPLFPMGV
jgi:Helicase